MPSVDIRQSKLNVEAELHNKCFPPISLLEYKIVMKSLMSLARRDVFDLSIEVY